jgi:hypothetical protein
MLDKLPATNTAEFMQSWQQTTIANAGMNTAATGLENFKETVGERNKINISQKMHCTAVKGDQLPVTEEKFAAN